MVTGTGTVMFKILSHSKIIEKPYVSRVYPIFIWLFCHKFFIKKRPNLGHLQDQNKTKTKNSYISLTIFFIKSLL